MYKFYFLRIAVSIVWPQVKIGTDADDESRFSLHGGGHNSVVVAYGN